MTYIDLHCDTISELQKQKKHLLDADLQINLSHLQSSKCLLQCFAMFIFLKKTILVISRLCELSLLCSSLPLSCTCHHVLMSITTPYPLEPLIEDLTF